MKGDKGLRREKEMHYQSGQDGLCIWQSGKTDIFKKDKELQELLIKTCCTTRERCITKVEKRVSVFGSTERRQLNNH